MLLDYFPVLMIDQFANYLCQKLIKIAPSHQLDKIMNVISKDFIVIAMDQHGTRPLQKLLEKIHPLTTERSGLLCAMVSDNIF